MAAELVLDLSDLDREAEALAAPTLRLQKQAPGLLPVRFIQHGSRRKAPLVQHQTVPDTWEEKQKEKQSPGRLDFLTSVF